MSRQSDAKVGQGYISESDRCSNCAHFTSEKADHNGGFGPYVVEKKLRCNIGGFKIQKYGGCKCHSRIKEGSK